MHQYAVVSKHNQKNCFKTYRSCPTSVQSHPVASQHPSLILFHPCHIHLGLRAFGLVVPCRHDLLLDMRYILKSLLMCHLLSEAFTSPLDLNLSLPPNTPFIFLKYSTFLHNIHTHTTYTLLVFFYLPPRI